MTDKRDKRNSQNEIVLPQSVAESFACFLMPEIRKFYESGQGKREFVEWEARNKEAEQADK
jgi:hypothetical protein